jgi:FtsH-binding integral membrane protein
LEGKVEVILSIVFTVAMGATLMTWAQRMAIRKNRSPAWRWWTLLFGGFVFVLWVLPPKGQRMLSNWTKAFLVWLAGFGAIVAVVASPNYPGDAAAFVCILWTIGGGAILGFAFTIKAIFWLLIPKNEV